MASAPRVFLVLGDWSINLRRGVWNGVRAPVGAPGTGGDPRPCPQRG
ncbi:hypothetical protein OO012_03245 [Rhodobacteraceae bacterium KMM 6894]|nr:hypothetical protein [Rhodobacteraceae bacterium KMM 6894]